MKLLNIFFIISAVMARSVSADTPLSLEDAIATSLKRSPIVQASAAQADAEHSAVRAQFSPDQPLFGIMTENNLTSMEVAEGPMRLWSVSQDLRFPLKYLWLGNVQKSRAETADHELSQKKLDIRKKVITAYYRAFGLDRILALEHANLESARKTARTAENRHSTGQVPQQDEMKAHVEETRINTEILLLEEERFRAIQDLALLLGTDETLSLPTGEISVPHLNRSAEEIQSSASQGSRQIRASLSQLQEAERRKTLATLDYLPDFRISYRRAFENAPGNAYALSVEATLPLWFFLKQTSNSSNASAMVAQAGHNLTQSQLETNSEVRNAALKAKNRETLLKIYETSLVPQAQSTLNSSEAAYRAGKISLLELLDSQRSLYQTRIAYYRMLSDFAEALSELEAMTGTSVSTLPFPPEKI